MQLNASTRDLLGKRSRQLHRQGKLAAVVYGHSAKPTPLVLDRLEFQKVFVKSGRTHLVDLTPLEEIESELRVSDLNVPKGVTVLVDPEELVVKIVHKRELKVEEEVPAAEAVVPAEGEAAAEGEAPEADEAAEKKAPEKKE